MKVSIVIAVLNSHKVVVRQLRHFKKMNLPEDIEIIFVDDGSEPPLNYQDCGLRNFSIYYTNDKRPWTQGLARNMGALKAKGEYLFFTDIDHIITWEAIQDVLRFNGDKIVFPRHYGILSRKGEIVNDRNSILEFGLDPKRLRGRRGFNAGFHGNTYAIKRTIFERMNGYNPRYCQARFHLGGKYWSEESDFNARFRRLVKKGEIKNEGTGSVIYCYPTSKFRADGNNNPFGLFHNLSLEQIPQPMME
jgi:glycosyltransferase involved in cell wall biosynthesis